MDVLTKRDARRLVYVTLRTAAPARWPAWRAMLAARAFATAPLDRERLLAIVRTLAGF
jgi:hypothetical protein